MEDGATTELSCRDNDRTHRSELTTPDITFAHDGVGKSPCESIEFVANTGDYLRTFSANVLNSPTNKPCHDTQTHNETADNSH